MSYQFSYIYLAPEDKPNHVVTRPYEYPDVDTAMRECENSQPAERHTRWGVPSTKDVARIDDWRFGLISSNTEALVVAVHPAGMAPTLISRIWSDLVQYEARAERERLHKRKTLFASATPTPTPTPTPQPTYLSHEEGLAMANRRRVAEGKRPWTQQYLDAVRTRSRIRQRQQALANIEYDKEQARLEELPPLTD
jgi:hypothetical protein